MTLKFYSAIRHEWELVSIEHFVNGWKIISTAESTIGIECDKKGNPELYKCLERVGISYPVDLQKYFEVAWAIDDLEARENFLKELADWVSAIEERKPIFNGQYLA